MYNSRRYDTYDPQSTYERPNAFLSAVLAVLAVVFLCVFIVLLVLRAANFASIIRNTDVAWVLEETGVSDDLLDQINDLPFFDTEIRASDVEDFIKSDAVSDEIGSVIDGYARAFADGDHGHHLTSRDIVDIARNLEPEFRDHFDHRMTDEDFNHIERVLDDHIDFRELSVGNIIDEMDIDPTIPQFFLSPYLLWGVGLLCFILLLIIFLRRRGNIADALLATGIPVVLAGLISFATGLFIGTFPESMGSAFHTMARFLGGPAYSIMQHGLAFAAAGALVILVSFVFKAIAPKV